MQNDFSLRPVNVEDLEAISEIYAFAVASRQTAHTEPPLSAYWRNWFKSHSAKYSAFILLIGKQVAGFASISPYREGRQAFKNVAEISYYLHPDHQRKGGGTFLVDALIKHCSANGFRHLVAILLGSNTASISLLEKTGFKKWGEMPGIAEFGEAFTSHLYYGKHLKK